MIHYYQALRLIGIMMLMICLTKAFAEVRDMYNHRPNFYESAKSKAVQPGVGKPMYSPQTYNRRERYYTPTVNLRPGKTSVTRDITNTYHSSGVHPYIMGSNSIDYNAPQDNSFVNRYRFWTSQDFYRDFSDRRSTDNTLQKKLSPILPVTPVPEDQGQITPTGQPAWP